MARNMRLSLTTGDGNQVDYRPECGFHTPKGIPCLRCGVCCTKWQPPVDHQEATEIARALGMTLSVFVSDYLQKYPLKDDYYLVIRKNGACTFLKFENGLAVCAIHDFKPEACRNWSAGLEKRECQEGLHQRGQAASLMAPLELQLSREELADLYRALT